MRRTAPGSAGLLLVPAAALVVHQLRYSLAYGSHAGAALAASGHSYLHSLVPWTVLALGIGFSSFLRRAAHALRTGESGTIARRSAVVLWAASSAGLLLVYVIQESLEELFATGHPTGFAGIFGHGGWWSLPACAVVSVVVVALLRLGRTLIRFAGRLAPRARTTALPLVRFGSRVDVIASRPLALAAAGRAPPRARFAG